MLESAKFEQKVKQFFIKKFSVGFAPKKIKIRGVEKNFDLVSDNGKYVGDVKFYKNIKNPSAKFATIAEYCWLLEKTQAKYKFIVFGQDKEVPIRWLKRFGNLIDIQFYFFNNSKLEKLN